VLKQKSISSLVKYSTLSSDTLISLSPLPLLRLVTDACTNQPSALWISLASTLTLRINSPPSALTQKRERTVDEEAQHTAEEGERWEVVGDASTRLLGAVGGLIGHGGVGEVSHSSMEQTGDKLTGSIPMSLKLGSNSLQLYVLVCPRSIGHMLILGGDSLPWCSTSALGRGSTGIHVSRYHRPFSPRTILPKNSY